MKAYTPEQLAATMIKEGLSRTVTRICLLTCGSGFAGSLPAWAERLKDVLSTHCPNLTVTGYLGDVSISPGHGTGRGRVLHFTFSLETKWYRSLFVRPIFCLV